MSEWKEVTISDIAEVVGGGTPKTAVSDFWNGDIAWLTPKDLTNYSKIFICKGERNITSNGLKMSSARLMPKGTVLLSSRAPIGYVAIAENQISTNQGFKSLIVDNKKAYNVFIYYWLKNNVDYLKANSSGTTFQEISGSSVKKLKITLPPLPEQKAIASVLSSLDDKIDLLHRQNKTLEAMAETLFRQWFVEEADESWEKINLSDYVDFLEGPGIRNWQYTEEGIPFINIRLIQNGDINVKSANHVSYEEGNGKYAHFHLKPSDMVMSTSGTLGRTSIVRKHHLPMILNTSVIRFRPHDNKTYSFMYQYLKSNQFYEHLVSSASGSVQLNFGPTHLKSMKIKMPPKLKLTDYCNIVDNYYNKIEFNQIQLNNITSLRDTLLPKLMSGEVKVDL